jgi:hypothetical protein
MDCFRLAFELDEQGKLIFQYKATVAQVPQSPKEKQKGSLRFHEREDGMVLLLRVILNE